MDRDGKDVPPGSSGKHIDDKRQPSSSTARDSSSYKTVEKEGNSSFPTSSYVQGNVRPDKVANKIKSALQHYVLDPPARFFEKRRECQKQKRVSASIDEELQKDYRRLHEVLVLGTEQSGKSTIIKQLRMMYGNEFEEEEKKQIAENIKQNVIDAILAISAAMPKLTPPITLQKSENVASLNYIKTCVSKSEFHYPIDIFEHVETLWKDKGIQAAYERGNEYCLADYAKHFFNRLSTIKSNNYIPTNEDILYCHTTHKNSVFDIHFNSDISPFVLKKDKRSRTETVFDFHVSEILVDQPRKRRLWTYFENCSSLIFVAACNSYDIVKEDNPIENRLQESMQLFKNFFEGGWTRIPIILFLNKQDLLLEKVLAGRSKLEDYFPTYASYQASQEKYFEVGEHHEVIRAKSFILDKFKEDIDGPHSDFYLHFTCAVNTENVRNALDTCCDRIRECRTCPCHLSKPWRSLDLI